MYLDLNDYYPSSNLPRLYRRRERPGDERRALEAATVAITACRVSLAENPDDPWARPTLLGAAYDRGDLVEAQELVEQISLEGAAAWHLNTTIADLQESAELHQDPAVSTGLHTLLVSLRGLASGEQV
jgi:hypothetical protein